MGVMSEIANNQRAQALLKTLVEMYIRDGQPVGSRTLARHAGIDLSSATIRNIMADLEDMDLIRAPHTSAGRVPTVHGYRVFIDSLLTIKPLNRKTMSLLSDQLGTAGDSRLLLSSASELLSEITSMAGIVMLPRSERKSLRQIEFLPLSDNRVLSILVTNESEVENRIIHTTRPFSQSELQQAANYLNDAFAGRDLDTVRADLVYGMEEAKREMNALMSAAVEMARQTLEESGDSEGDYLIAGETKLMRYSEMANVGLLRQLFEAFNQKNDVLHLLDQSLDAQGVQIFVGEESGYDVFRDCSVVTAPYQKDGAVVGVLGVIGPKRMAYGKVIPLVDVTARLIGLALDHIH